jgi:hypothetical protein
MRVISFPWPLVGLAVVSCGSATATDMPTTTTARLFGAMCGVPGQPCRCADELEDLGHVTAGRKRFEVRLGQVSESESAVTIDGVGTLVRPPGEQGDRCFYLDLAAPSSYAVTVHGRGASRERGVAVAYMIREYDPRTRRFYMLVNQQCGDATSVCPHDDAGDWSTEYANGRGGWDPCSSTRIERYEAMGGFYDRHPTDVDITFTMRVYEFTPRREAGSEGCGGGR